MKKKLLIFVAICTTFFSISVNAQTENFSSTNEDYSKYVHTSLKQGQEWKITGIKLDDNRTYIYIEVDIISNMAGAPFGFKCGGSGSDHIISISGPSFKYTCDDSNIRIKASYIKPSNHGGDLFYPAGNKGSRIFLTFVFPRIPLGVDSLRLIVIGGKCGDCTPRQLANKFEAVSFSMKLPILDNEDNIEKTGWTEPSLRSYWDQNKCEYIEGIYCFTNTSDTKWWGPYKHNLAVKKDGYEYKVIYLNGGLKGIWKEGDVKARFIATGTPGLYKVTEWYMENKLPCKGDFYIAFDNTTMKIYENSADIFTNFLKLYPSFDLSEGTISAQDAAKNEGGIKTREGVNNSDSNNWVGSGSGFFISRAGHIATNYHVVEGMTNFQVEYYQNGKKFVYPAKIIATDPNNDMAIIRVDHKDYTPIPAIPYKFDSKTKDVGTDVFTLGYPLTFIMGEEIKYTTGEISAKSGYQGDIRTYQISVPITNGNSGGPLFDYDGNIIGITSSGLKKDIADNVNYAIKSIYLQTLIEACQEHIEQPSGINLSGKTKPEIIKALQGYVVLIKVK